MKRILAISALIGTTALLGCPQPTAKVDGGGVILSVSDFDGLPAEVSVAGMVLAGSILTLGEITINNHAKNPGQGTSSLMNVEMQSYEVTFSRADTGTLLPPPLVQAIFGVTPVDGTRRYENLRILSVDQVESRPLRDLMLINGGFDKETGQDFIRLNITIRFFGKTLAGEGVATAPVGFTVTFTR